mmetsp:Transcript_36945/g.94479  ORF Transcript_36945/g.94479 Transcript_36945/m.94479 type:complete len:691 (-) Transcript_36945:11-2083(-)
MGTTAAGAATRLTLILLAIVFGALVSGTYCRSLKDEDAEADGGYSLTPSMVEAAQPAAGVRLETDIALVPEEPRLVAENLDRREGDSSVFLIDEECLDGSFLEVSDISGAVLCRALCEDEPRCLAFTWSSSTERCFLAESCNARGEQTGNVSGEVPLAEVEEPKAEEGDAEEGEVVDDQPDVDLDEEDNDGNASADEEVMRAKEPGGNSTAGAANQGRREPFTPRNYTLYEDTECAVALVLAEKRNISDVEVCRAECDRRKACRAFTYNPESLKCFLAPNCKDRARDVNNISGVDVSLAAEPFVEQEDDSDSDSTFSAEPEDGGEYNLYERTGCLGDTLAFKTGFTSLAECQAWCDMRQWQGCGAFVYNSDRNRCYLKRNCDEREIEPDNVSGVKSAVDECAVSTTCSTDDSDMVCPEITETRGEMADPVYGTFEPPYKGIRHRPTYRKRKEYPTCNFQPPRDPLPKDWVDECIDNARGVGFLRERERRPNDECPAGWFLCKGMCYTLSQRNNRGPERGTDYYADDFMFVESRCGLCGGARVAFVGDDPDMQRVAAEAAERTLNEDKATWVRRFRFLEEPNRKVKSGRPYQPWHLYVEMFDDNKREATYQRYYTGEKDGSRRPSYDRRYRNQEASILCVNTIQRIQQAVKYPDESNLTMERGCRGDDKDDKWDNDEHQWRPQKHYPFPGH